MAAARLAKLSAPRTANWVVRSRLHRSLDEAAAQAAVWVAAGPGAGKTTLAASWAATRGPRTLWYRVDEGDRDPRTAFGYFAELARGRRRTAVLPMYQPHDLHRLDAFARAFFRAFFAAIPAAATLIVDDAHAAAGGEFDVLLAAAIREAPHDVSLLILSRHEPTGPLLEEMTRGALKPLDDALTFTSGEAAELLVGRCDRATALGLQRQTGGWVAGMLLMAQSPQAESGRAPVGRERISAFFTERVLAGLRTDERQTLAAAALLPDIDVAGLRALGLPDTAAETLERLRKQHSFVSRLERQPPSWRLHDLLRDALAERFDREGDAAWRERVLRAAAVLASARGLAREAVHLLLHTGDAPAALSAAEDAAPALVKGSRLHEIESIAARLGSAVDHSRILQTALGECAWQRNDAKAAVAHYERAYALQEEPAPSATALLLTASALGAILEGWQDFEDTGRWMQRLQEHLDARPRIADADAGLRVDRACLQATNMIWDSSLGDVKRLIMRMLESLRRERGMDVNEVVATSSVLLEAAGYRLSNGDLFREVVGATAAWLQRGELAPLTKANWLITYAPLGRRWPTPGIQLPAVDPVACLELAIALAREHGGRNVAFSGALFLAHMAVATNDRAAAPGRLAALRELVDASHPRQVINVLEVESNVLALNGDWAGALKVLRRARELAEQHAFPSSQLWNMEVYEQRLAIAAGNFAQARAALTGNAERYPQGNRRDFALILADVAAVGEALRADGAPPEALVRAIIERCRVYDWPGFAAHLGPLAVRICAEAMRLGIETEFVRRAVNDRRLAPPSPFEVHWPWPIRIRALGTLAIELDGQPLEFGPRAHRKSLDLLKLMVAHGPASVDSAVVLDALWPDADGAAARAAFDMSVMRLRKLLGRTEALRLEASRIGLDPALVWVDAFAFAQGATDDYPGPLFGSDAVQSWWAAARERLHQRFLRRACERARALEQRGEHEAALAIYEAGLAQDPLAEELYQGAIRCHLAAGRASNALHTLRRCREQLSIVLGVKPSPATLALIARAGLD
ncbi:MAG TPA: BTAD domain-containing putative transcriptional regulator [Burkholderiaceae bacterium]|nr:BTAD domain-containing putative transcriptional regulator [Burkholderiaceae bacterium]